ncbi:MAG TPA: reverse transcriptase domain-containing protein [Ktedonobacteraceae bacterium]|nr:reverse transcriptase domain-containing protein [Ktedonobacteraceae bacterium]
MLSATVMRRLEALGDISKQGKRLNGLFRLLEDRILWYEAYANIYANTGAITPGVDGVTLDGFSKERVTLIIKRLKDGTYQFQPTRRVYIPKKNGKKRPLGISSGDDKLVQEVVRIILERIYEPIFEDASHGFRPGRSPHTALTQIGDQWQSIKWLVDMDIRDYFNTINHELLMSFLTKKIEDKRFLRLVQAMLDAGYLEDWRYHTTYSGVPQGSIVSPVLANVYLHELDCFMKTLKENFDQGKKRSKNSAYNRYCGKIERLRKKGDTLKGKEGKEQELQDIQQEIRRVDHLRKQLPSGDPFDEGYKRLFYCRFADDFAIGIIGSFADAEAVRQQVTEVIQGTLKLTIAEEKSHICHSKKGMIFVGYEVKTYSGDRVIKMKRGNRHTTLKSVSERIQLHIPKEKLSKFCTTKGYGNYETTKAIHKKEWTQSSDAEIILAYNAELRGLANYYALALNAKMVMHKLAHVWRVSLLKTLANKHKTSVNKTANRLKRDDGYALILQEKEKTRVIRIFRLKDLRKPLPSDPEIDKQPNVYTWTLSRSEVIKRLNRGQCEYCETKQGPFEVHHIRKMKDVAKGKALWQQMMAAKHRKTLVLCQSCHQQLHAGTLPGREVFKHA